MKKAIIYFDGACLPRNPGGIATYGFVIKDNGVIVYKEGGVVMEHGTNNIAEYSALIKALEHAYTLGYDEVFVKGDSQLVINQIKGLYTAKSPSIIPLYRKAIGLLQKFRKYTVQWIKRDQNTEADLLSTVSFIKHMEDRNLKRAIDINPRQVTMVNENTFQIRQYIVRINPPECNCPYFRIINNAPLLKKDRIIVRCKHILYVEHIYKKEVLSETALSKA
ncbi:MAG: ribonuclease HI [Caldanaerobacter sp.]